MSIAFITPTKDRPVDLRRMLQSLKAQGTRPAQVIIVDAGIIPVLEVIEEFPELKIDYQRWNKEPSAAGQRNGGIALLNDDVHLVCFFDDDQALYPNAIEKMVAFWKNRIQAANDHSPIGAASFFDVSWKDDRPSGLKKSRLSEKLGLYVRKPGGVAPSGWQSLYYGDVNGRNLYVDWMSSQAIVIKRNILDEYRFDEFFTGYSYLEDLDFSYTIGRKYRMVVVADAKFEHFHSPHGRGDAYSFGRAEVRNRRYIVKKHNLSLASYRIAMTLRWVMNIINRDYFRAMGNIIESFQFFKQYKD